MFSRNAQFGAAFAAGAISARYDGPAA